MLALLHKSARVVAGVFFACIFLNGCATIIPQTVALRDSWPSDLPLRVELDDVPFFPQTEYQCGPAALATALVNLNVPTSADELVDRVYIPARKGSIQVEMLAAPRRFGMVSYALAPQFADVLREIAAGVPVIVLQNLGAGPFRIWHYAVAVGYDGKSGTLFLRSGEQRRRTLPLAAFEFTWKDSGYWAMVVVPPGRMPVTADRARYFESIVAVERAGDPRSAAVAYSRFLERWPDDLGAHIGIANAHYALRELDQAEAALRRAIEQHPDSVIALNNLAHTLSESGRSAEALKLIERAAAGGGSHASTVRETREQILQKLQQR